MGMNEAARQLIRERMAALGLSQDRLAEQITEARQVRTDAGARGTVTRHAISRAISHGGELPPLLSDVLESLGLELVLVKKAGHEIT